MCILLVVRCRRRGRLRSMSLFSLHSRGRLHPSARKTGALCHPRSRKSGAIREPWRWGPRWLCHTSFGWFGHRRRALREFFPEELAPIEDFAATQVKDVYGKHVIFKVVAENVLVVAFGRGNALLFLELRDG